MRAANLDLGICMLDHRIMDRPAAQWITAANTECYAQENAWYRACLGLRAGFNERECTRYLAEEILGRLGIR